MNRPYMAELSKGALVPDCYLIPDGIVGHPTASCPYGDADDRGDLKAARQLMQESGSVGLPVVVWVEDSSPERAYARYYTKLLNRLGFDARTKTVSTAQDFGRVGKGRTEPQTGFASWFNDFPNPLDFYSVLDSRFIGPPGSPNAGHVNDLFIQQQLEKLSLVAGAGPGLRGRRVEGPRRVRGQEVLPGRVRHAAGAEADQRAGRPELRGDPPAVPERLEQLVAEVEVWADSADPWPKGAPNCWHCLKECLTCRLRGYINPGWVQEKSRWDPERQQEGTG